MEMSALDALKVENAASQATQRPSNGVDRESFLNLLVTQLRNQDPLEPVGQTEFISQLASFQSLESQMSMGRQIGDLVALQESTLALAGLSQAALLVGKHVTWIDGEGKEGAGTIDSVTVENGVMMVNTKNGKIPVGALTSIAVAPSETPPATPPAADTPAPPAAGSPATPPFLNLPEEPPTIAPSTL